MFLRKRLDKIPDEGIVVALLFFFLFIPFFLIHATEQTSPDRYQQKSYFEKRIFFEHLSLEQGLSQSTVNCVAQDRKGFIWIGTQGGVNRYDGYNFKIFKHYPDDSTTLSINWATDLYIDHNGIMWVVTTDGVLHKYNVDMENFKRLAIYSPDTDQRVILSCFFIPKYLH